MLARVSPERHLRWSLALVALFLAMGLWLEAMIGLRAAGWVDDPLRREFLRLGHAHGGVLALLNVGVAWALGQLQTPTQWAGTIRRATLLGALLVGGGFVAGGLTHGPTDPGPPVLVVPAGALMLVGGVVATALVRPGDRSPGSRSPEG
jgi:peptidoglycan/LPS O-acetylase OafA/YrhL